MANENTKQFIAYAQLTLDVIRKIILKIVAKVSAKVAVGIATTISSICTGVGIVLAIVSMIFTISDFIAFQSSLKKARDLCYYMYRRLKRLKLANGNKIAYDMFNKALDYAENNIIELSQQVKEKENNIIMQKKYFIINPFNSFILVKNIVNWFYLSNELQKARNGMFLDYIIFCRVKDYIDTKDIFNQDKTRITTFIFDNNIEMLNIFALALEELEIYLTQFLQSDITEYSRNDATEVLADVKELLSLFSPELLENLKYSVKTETQSVDKLFNSVFKYMDYSEVFSNTEIKEFEKVIQIIYPQLDIYEYCLNVPEYPLHLLKDFYTYFGFMMYNDIYIKNYLEQIKNYVTIHTETKKLYTDILQYMNLNNELVDEYENYMFAKSILTELKNENYKKVYLYYLKAYEINEYGQSNLIDPAKYNYKEPLIEDFKEVIADMFKSNKYLKDIDFEFYKDLKDKVITVNTFKDYYDNIEEFKNIIKAIVTDCSSGSTQTNAQRLDNGGKYICLYFSNLNSFSVPQSKDIALNRLNNINWTEKFENRYKEVAYYKYTAVIYADVYNSNKVLESSNKKLKTISLYSFKDNLTSDDLKVQDYISSLDTKLNKNIHFTINRAIDSYINIYDLIKNYAKTYYTYPLYAIRDWAGRIISDNTTVIEKVDWVSVFEKDLNTLDIYVNEVYKKLIYPEISNPDYISIFSQVTVDKNNQYIFNLWTEILNLMKSNVGYLLKQSFIIPIYRISNIKEVEETITTIYNTVKYKTADVELITYINAYDILRKCYNKTSLLEMFYNLNENAINQLFAYASGNFKNKIDMYNYYQETTPDYTELIIQNQQGLDTIVEQFNERMSKISLDTIYASMENDIINSELEANLKALEQYKQDLADEKITLPSKTDNDENNQTDNTVDNQSDFNDNTDIDEKIEEINKEIEKTQENVDKTEQYTTDDKTQTKKDNSLLYGSILGIISYILFRGSKDKNE